MLDHKDLKEMLDQQDRPEPRAQRVRLGPTVRPGLLVRRVPWGLPGPMVPRVRKVR